VAAAAVVVVIVAAGAAEGGEGGRGKVISSLDTLPGSKPRHARFSSQASSTLKLYTDVGVYMYMYIDSYRYRYIDVCVYI